MSSSEPRTPQPSLPSAPRPADDDDTEDFLKPDNWVGRTDVWKVEKGAIVGETKEDLKYNTFLVSKATYGDFELSFKVQLRDGVGNSGVQIRSTLRDDKKFIVAGPKRTSASNTGAACTARVPAGR